MDTLGNLLEVEGLKHIDVLQSKCLGALYVEARLFTIST